MNAPDRSLALLVVLLWGLNFIAIDIGLQHFPPMLFAAVRFTLIAVPTVLLVPFPDVEWRWLIGYGLGYGTLQFAFLFVALDIGMPTGLASLVLQASAPFTVVLGVVLLRERTNPLQVAGIVIAVLGMVAIGWSRAQSAALLPVLLTVLGALSWAVGNLCNRRANPSNPLHLTLWMSIVPPLPMFALSLLTEGPQAGWQAVSTAFSSTEGWMALGALVYVILLGTIGGAGIWAVLMGRNPAGSVAPFSLLVPVVGITAAWLVLGERPEPFELAAGAVVVFGVLLGSVRRRPAEVPAAEAPAAEPVLTPSR
ncbi:EamA family transporter [Saccharopolyspora taberi]|uniref:EamA family transporter n=1 Tax=Saccharopolyspora taberi TaxID=60895 RepID=A0ABN3VNU8_9PSEU